MHSLLSYLMKKTPDIPYLKGGIEKRATNPERLLRHRIAKSASKACDLEGYCVSDSAVT